MLRKHKPFNPWRILILLALIGGAAYVNFIIVPQTPPLFVPTTTPTRAPESYVVDADALASQGKFAQAIEMYKNAVNADPNNPNNFISMAKAQISLQKYKDAQTSAENALLLNNNNPTAHALRGYALALQDDFLLAENSIKQAIQIDPNSGLAHAYYAELLIMVNDAGQGTIGTVEKAIEESRLAYALAPDTMEAHRARGIVLQNTQNYAPAIQEFQQAIQLAPNVPDLHILLGDAYRAVDPPELDKAVTEYTTANALNPPDPMPDTLIARTYANIGEYPKAVQSAELAVGDAPTDPYMWGNYGTMLYRNQQLAESASAMALAVRGGTTPTGETVEGLPLDYGRAAEYFYIYGLALAKLNKCSEAVEISQLLLQGVPNDETAVYNANAIVIICQGGDPNAVTPEAETADSGEVTETPSP